MKKYLIALVFGTLLVSAKAQESSKEPYLVKSLTSDAIQNVKVETSGGNISLTSLAGTQDFTTSGGNLNIDHLTGHIKGRTSGGNITLSDLKDDIDLSTSGGNINAGNANGDIRLSTSGGSLTLRELQ